VYRTSNTTAQKWPETTAELNALPASKPQKASSDSGKTHTQLAENLQAIQAQNSQRLLQAHRANDLQSRDNLLNSPYLALAEQTTPTASNTAASNNAKPFIMPFVGTPKKNQDIISTFKAVADFAVSPTASAAPPLPDYAGLAAAAEKRPALPDDIDWNKGKNATLPPVSVALNQLMNPQPKVNPFVNTPLVNGGVKGYTGNNTSAPSTGSDTQGNTILDGLQVALDVAGLVPGFGELADGLNALISLLRGNYADAALSAAAMIPFAGWGATAGKAAKNILKATDAFGTVAKHADEAIDVGEALLKNADVFDNIAEGAGDVGKIITEVKYTPSSGAMLIANPNKSTTILGSFDKDMKNIVNEMGNVKSTYFGAKKGGFNVLNVPDNMYKSADQFWNEVNKPWLDEAIKRGDDIVLATKPTDRAISYIDINTGKEIITGFGREYKYLLDNGYVYDAFTSMMIRK
jgi:hypothetical protein